MKTTRINNMKALIVVDCQNDFSENGSIPVIGASKNAFKIKNFINSLDRNEWKIIFCKDWHPKNHISFYKWKSHCVKWTYGSKLITPLNMVKPDLLIKKAKNRNIEELSPFSKKENSKIYKFLRKNCIFDVYICGLIKEICVFESCIDAYNLGFNTNLIDDLSLYVNEYEFQKKWKKYKNIKILISREINKIHKE